MDQEKKLEARMHYDSDTLRFHRYRIVGPGVNGTLYFAKSEFKQGVPQKVRIESDRHETD